MTDLAALTGAVKARWIASRAMRRAEGEFAVTESAWCVFGARRDEYSSDQILRSWAALGRLPAAGEGLRKGWGVPLRRRFGAFLRTGGSLSEAESAPSSG